MVIFPFVCALTVCAAVEDGVNGGSFAPLEKGAADKIGWYRPNKLDLSEEKPASVVKLPDGVSPTLFGTIKVGSGSYVVAVDETEGKAPRLLVDSNGNGDLTDDSTPAWDSKPNRGRDGKEYSTCFGTTTLSLGGDKPFAGSIKLYRFDKNDPTRAAFKKSIFYYRDYAMEGEVTLNGKTYKALLSDDTMTGSYSGRKIEGEMGSGLALLLDINGNGKYENRGELFDAAGPFNIGGTTYEISDIANSGSKLTIAKSSKQVDEIPIPPDHSVGKKITAFSAKTMDGKSINFPGDYKGKVVMLDFWATWCGPCMAEVPNVVAAYEKYHDKGFEVLGITLDREDSADKVTKVTGDKHMAWPQVYDGKYWKAEVAVKYGIQSIPATFLVDGDSGEILAVGSRGEKLAQDIDAALAKKHK